MHYQCWLFIQFDANYEYKENREDWENRGFRTGGLSPQCELEGNTGHDLKLAGTRLETIALRKRLSIIGIKDLLLARW